MSLATQQLLPRRQVPQLLPLPSFRRLLFTRLRRISCAPATSCKNPPPPEEPGHFAIHYLVNSCGLSSVEALRASKPLAHLRSTQKPDAVLRLMKQHGLGDAQIRRLVVRRPTVLVADVKKTLEPKIRAMLEAGFSGPEVAQLISSSGAAIPCRSVLRRIEFWRDLLGNNQNLLKALDRNANFLSFSIEERVIPTLSFLRSLGISDKKIGTIMMRSYCLVTRSLEGTKALVDQVKNLGISPGSGLFVAALCTLSNLSKSTLDSKVQLLRSFGWSQADLGLAFRRCPNFLNVSQKKLRTMMDFLLKEAGCSPVYVAGRPVLLGFSIERRLIPRFRVIQSLKMRCLRGGDHDLYNFMLLTDKKFVDKYIIPNREKAPEVLEAYLAASAKSISR
uniref:mTERF domain-containing protein 1, mitochondrial n=1 Tax=Anthurium amnicola TaxID=1678845 RepID=A0A1D1YLI6_9ARAE